MFIAGLNRSGDAFCVVRDDILPIVAVKWEYSQLLLTRDPGKDLNEIYGFLALPGSTEWKQLGLPASISPTLNQLGSAGWELLGPPVDVNAVFTYQAANTTWHDRASFVEHTFWFKRQVGSS
ncbi:hypothetical protein ACQPZJ_14525 [Actinoplanes sp. CA-054009]